MMHAFGEHLLYFIAFLAINDDNSIDSSIGPPSLTGREWYRFTSFELIGMWILNARSTFNHTTFGLVA